MPSSPGSVAPPRTLRRKRGRSKDLLAQRLYEEIRELHKAGIKTRLEMAKSLDERRDVMIIPVAWKACPTRCPATWVAIAKDTWWDRNRFRQLVRNALAKYLRKK